MNWIFPHPYTEDDAPCFAGFVYLITNLKTGRKYVGRKFLYTSKNKESDWRSYYGSCKPLKEDIKRLGKEHFKREVLSLHITRKETSYAEVREQFRRDVLQTRMTLPDGSTERAYYNGNIASRWFCKSQITGNRKRSKLTDDQVREIRNSDLQLKDLAEEFDLSVPRVSMIKRGLTHDWVE